MVGPQSEVDIENMSPYLLVMSNGGLVIAVALLRRVFAFLVRILKRIKDEFYTVLRAEMRIRFWSRKRIRGSVSQTKGDFKKSME